MRIVFKFLRYLKLALYQNEHAVSSWPNLAIIQSTTHNAAELKVIIDFHQLIESVLVEDDKFVKRWADLSCTVQTVNNVLLVLLQNKQNAEYFRLTHHSAV